MTPETPVAKILRELIALPSVNPAFLPAGDSRAGEQRVADFLAATAARQGLDIEFREVFPGRANLLARDTPSGSNPPAHSPGAAPGHRGRAGFIRRPFRAARKEWSSLRSRRV